MTDYATAMQQAIYNRLEADATLNSLFGGSPRVYDRVSKDAAFPYIRIGEDRLTIDDFGCNYWVKMSCMVHVFSRGVGKIELKNIAGAVRNALNAEIPITGYTIKHFEFISMNYLTDPDGLTEHAALTIHYGIVEN